MKDFDRFFFCVCAFNQLFCYAIVFVAFAISWLACIYHVQFVWVRMCQLRCFIPTLIFVRFKHVLDDWTASEHKKNERKSETVHDHLFRKICFFRLVVTYSHRINFCLLRSLFGMKNAVFDIFVCSPSHLPLAHSSSLDSFSLVLIISAGVIIIHSNWIEKWICLLH